MKRERNAKNRGNAVVSLPQYMLINDTVDFSQHKNILILNGKDAQLALMLAKELSNTQITVSTTDLNDLNTITKNILNEPNVRNCTVKLTDSFIEENTTVDCVLYEPDRFVSKAVIKKTVTVVANQLQINGDLYFITHKKMGAESFIRLLSEMFGDESTTIQGKGFGGYRIIKCHKQRELSAIEDISKEISFTIFDREITVFTEPSLFSKDDLDVGTRLLLETTFEKFSQINGKLLDVGCGWGAIGLITALTNPNLEATLIDIDPHAVELSVKNAQKLGLLERINAIVTNNIARDIHDEFEIAISNPPFHVETNVLIDLFKSVHSKLRKGAVCYIVVEKTYLIKLENVLKEVFGNVTSVVEGKHNFWILASTR